jgi:hypothetical protein
MTKRIPDDVAPPLLLHKGWTAHPWHEMSSSWTLILLPNFSIAHRLRYTKRIHQLLFTRNCAIILIHGDVFAITIIVKSYPCNRPSRLPHFLDNRLIDGGELVSLTSRSLFTPRKIPSTHFCRRLSRALGHSAGGMIRSIKKSNYLIGNRTHDLPYCNMAH